MRLHPDADLAAFGRALDRIADQVLQQDADGGCIRGESEVRMLVRIQREFLPRAS